MEIAQPGRDIILRHVLWLKFIEYTSFRLPNCSLRQAKSDQEWPVVTLACRRLQLGSRKLVYLINFSQRTCLKINYVSIYLAGESCFFSQSRWFFYFGISCTIRPPAKQDGFPICFSYGWRKTFSINETLRLDKYPPLFTSTTWNKEQLFTEVEVNNCFSKYLA